MKQPADRRKWTRVIDSLPPENVEVETKVDDHMGVRNEYTMIRSGRLWYLNDDDPFPFYAPTHWREKQNKEVLKHYNQ